MVEIDAIEKQPFFTGFNQQELALLAPLMDSRTYKTGETVFSTDDEDQELHLIQSGEAKACVAALDGELFTLNMLKAGDVFGLMSVVDGAKRAATLVALSELETFTLGHAALHSLISRETALGNKLMGKIVASAHEVIRGMNDRYVQMVNYMWGRKRFT